MISEQYDRGDHSDLALTVALALRVGWHRHVTSSLSDTHLGVEVGLAVEQEEVVALDGQLDVRVRTATDSSPGLVGHGLLSDMAL